MLRFMNSVAASETICSNERPLGCAVRASLVICHPAMASFELTLQGDEPHLIPIQKSPKKLKKEIDDSKRDEWSIDAITSLLDVYEAKWNFRNRGNLKGSDWEDVASCVTSRFAGTRSSKTPFQCKNKVASMKQKYRSECLLRAITACSSRWQFFSRMDHMLHAPTNTREEGSPVDGLFAITDLRFQDAVPHVESGDSEHGALRRDQSLYLSALQQREKAESLGAIDQNRDSNQEDASNTLPHRRAHESNTSIPRSRGTHMPGASGKPSNKHKKHFGREVADSICTFADSILKLEQAKMEMFKDSERLRAELEARRTDMELKRTEIIMNTQLQIAKLLSKNVRKRKTGKSIKGKPGMTSGTQGSALPDSLNQIPVEVIQNADMTQPLRTMSYGTHTSEFDQSEHYAADSK